MRREEKTLNDYQEVLNKRGLLTKGYENSRSSALVSGFTYYSGKVSPGCLFLCKGAGFREEYLQEAVQKGAVAYISETEYEAGKTIPCLLVNDIRKAQVVLADAFFEYPEEKLHLIGITGTKGKTTTAYDLQRILDDSLKQKGEKGCALLSSVEYYDGKGRETASLTTPEALELWRHMRNAVDAGLSHLVMEVSSQALKYERIGNLKYEIGIFLNISEDHISPVEHPDFEDYFTSKCKLFSQCRTAIINLDSACSDRILQAAEKCERVVTFGRNSQALIRASEVRYEKDGYHFLVSGPNFRERIDLPVHGAFHVENALAAVAAAWILGIPASECRMSLKRVTVPGRMETYESRRGEVTAIVDFAHNGLSFEKVFDAVEEEYPGSRVSVVFGCPGGKAGNRRMDMGRIAGRRAERIFLVPDDPAEEDPMEISGEISKYVKESGRTAEIRSDHGQAIREAILTAEPGEVILVLGKGAEQTIKIGKRQVPYMSDAVWVQKALDDYGDVWKEAAVTKET